MAGVLLYVWDGSKWVRAKATPEGALYIVEGHRDILQVRRTTTGSIVKGHYHVQWLTFNPSAANNLVEFTDDEDGSTAVVWDFFRAAREAQHINFSPTFHFDNGIYLKTLTNITSIIIGYEKG